MSFCKGYKFFPTELVFVNAGFNCMSEFWMHHVQEFLKFNTVWNLTFQVIGDPVYLDGGKSYPLYFSMLFLRYLIPLFPIDVAACCRDTMVLNSVQHLGYGDRFSIGVFSSLCMVIIPCCVVHEISKCLYVF